MKNLLLLVLMVSFLNCNQQTTEKKDQDAILSILETQRIAWSNGHIDTFMDGYWKDDALKFYGSSGVTYGWNNTLERYKKGYPTKEDMGSLKFKINDISKINDGAYYVMGEYILTRTVGNANGIFMIIFRKIDGVWKIIADTSC